MHAIERSILISILPLFVPLAATAESSRYEIGVRGNVLLGDGQPANDILGFGIAGRYYLADGWFVAAAIESYDYDFERPIEVVGLRQDPAVKTIDARTTMTVASAALGRIHGQETGRFDWFWSLGVGAGFPDVADATGPLLGGGTFDLQTDAGAEFHLQAKLGIGYRISPRWSVNATARAEQHFMDYKVTERTSGATGSVDSQTPLGAHFGISYRF